jgi:hypothetical protein
MSRVSKPPAEALQAGLARMNWVEDPLYGGVQFAYPERSPVHRAKNLNIADRG